MTSRRTRRLARLDKRHVWHPFTQMREWDPDDFLIIEKGKGSYLYDTEGRRYLDGVSSLWCNVHGHRVPELDRAVKAQLGRIAHSTFLGLSNVPAILLSRRLVRIAPPGLNKVFYSDSGSEAVEIGLKMAFQYWKHKGKPGKIGFLKLTNAYHGDTVGAVSVGGIGLFHEIFGPLLFKTFSADAPDRYHEKFRASDDAYAALCASRVEKVLKKRSGSIAAIVMEPLVQGAAGMITHPRGFLKRVRRLADRYGVLLILDEVATGFGRTGRMFACEHEGVRPDILCLGKGLSGGYLPLAATLTTDEIYNEFLGRTEEFKTFFHGHTYTANPLACAVALANLERFGARGVIAANRKLIRGFTRRLADIACLPHVGDVRQCGLMAGIELVQDKASNRGYPVGDKIGARVARCARDKGVIIRPLGNVIVLMPPFSFTEAELAKLCGAVRESIAEITAHQ